ncbi:purple acid phosphatase family protein [Neolewinella persica]|uniref:purple acid phosphatase family protein n=1 Tax=Neolewinella persica TaxID=70998 RepID=UPI001469DE15|nr:metallophosphoesterase family protein [Neolewinella persica]
MPQLTSSSGTRFLLTTFSWARPQVHGKLLKSRRTFPSPSVPFAARLLRCPFRVRSGGEGPGERRTSVASTSVVSFLLLFTFLLSPLASSANTQRYRLTWRADPATTMTIGFEQYHGSSARVVYGTEDHGRDANAYPLSANPARFVNHAGMRNVFVRLKGLTPATVYYFLVVDSDGTSRRMSFETPHDSPDRPLSIIAGGDSRNNRETAMAANRLVSKLKPHFVMFGGDMTNGDTPEEWQQWLDDWQATISSDGRLTPIVAARGNHERSNESIYEIFDVPNPKVYYSLDFAGGLLRTYTLNSLFPAGGDQADWLEQDLASCKTMWKFAQYHHSMRPHTVSKPERDELIYHWGTKFYRYGMNLVVESDVHTVKQTWPIRPSQEPGSSQGFIRDDLRGTVYVGEGCWGAPLRANNDNKPWTRASGRFNQFKWIWVDINQVQVRTVMIDRSSYVVQENNLETRFKSPPGMYYWDAANTGDVLRILRRTEVANSMARNPPLAAQSTPSIQAASAPAVLVRDGNGAVRVSYSMPAGGRPEILIVGAGNRLLWRGQLPVRGPGPYSDKVDLPELPRGTKMELVVKAGGKVVAKYELR